MIVELPEAEANSVTINDEWVIDSGCNRHMGRALRWMTSYQPFEQPKTVQLGGSRATRALGSGTAKLTVLKDGRPTTSTPRDTLYIPEFRKNLISMSQLAGQRFGIGIKPEAITIRQS